MHTLQTFRILFVVTSADRMGDAPTGSWLEEVAAPYYTFKDARCTVVMASPRGGRAPMDATSLQEENLTASTRRWDADTKAQTAFRNTEKLGDVSLNDFDAIFFAGGHGTMADFPTDASVRAAVEHFYEAGTPLSAVCHGPACLVSAKKPDGRPLIAHHPFACFTDAEETIVGLDKTVPFMLESTLRDQGGRPMPALPFTSNVVVDGNLITGQNPASAIPVAEAVIHQLRTNSLAQAA